MIMIMIMRKKSFRKKSKTIKKLKWQQTKKQKNL